MEGGAGLEIDVMIGRQEHEALTRLRLVYIGKELKKEKENGNENVNVNSKNMFGTTKR